MKRLRAADKRAGCPTGKVRYLTNAQATLRLLVIEGRPSKGDRKPIRVYSCERCGGFHLTSQQPRRVRA